MSTHVDLRPRQFRHSPPDYEATHFRTHAWRSGKARSAAELKPYHPTLLHAFAEAARLEEKVGITLLGERSRDPEEHESYRQIYHDARRIASALHALGVRENDKVLLVLPTSFDFVKAFFGTLLLHAVPVPAYPPAGFRVETGLARLGHIARDSGAKVCVTWNLVLPVIGDLALRVPGLEHIVAIEEMRQQPKLDAKFRASRKEIAFLQYTSGSTGNPKGVTLTHGNLVANIHAIGQAIEISRSDGVASWCPLYHDMGLIGGLLFSFYWRVPLVLMSPTSFLARPRRWLDAITRHRATMSPAPNFGYGLCVKKIKPEQREGLDLSSWRVALNGAEPVNMTTVRQFEQAFGPCGFQPTSMLPVYGLAEASLAVTFPAQGRPVRAQRVDRDALANGHAVESADPDALQIVSVGSPVPGHDVAVVDAQGEPLPDREVGHVLVSGPSVMQGYYGRDEATAEIITDGWLWTGDLGYFSEGELFVTGRVKDLIILRGKNYYAEDIERAAETVDGARPGACVAFAIYDEELASDVVVLVCETKLTEMEERVAMVEGISKAVTEDCGLQLDEVVLVQPGSIPKTSSGKRQRSLCRDRYLRGELEPLRTGKLRMGLVFMRSQAGYLLMQARKLMSKRRAPD